MSDSIATRAVVVVQPDDAAGAPWRTAIAAAGHDVIALTGGHEAATLRHALSDAGDPAAPLAVVGIGAAARAAAVAASYDPRVAGVVLAFADLAGSDLRAVFGVWKEVPVLVVVDARDRSTLIPALATRWSSSHPDSDVHVVSSIDAGDEHFGSWDDSRDGALAACSNWLQRVLNTVDERVDVVFRTDDGWEIHGSLTAPRAAGDVPVPAAVLLHSGRSDRAVFSRLERLLARRGVATLSIDWRGRGRSQNKATYFELSAEQRAEAWRDVRAAMTLLAEHRGIDDKRVAMIGVVHGAEHAVAASIGDPRVRMLGILTGYVPRSDEEAAHLTSGAIDVYYVSCTGHGPVTGAMRDLVRRTPPGHASLRVYPGSAIGYQLFDVDHQLEETLAAWVAAGLKAETSE